MVSHRMKAFREVFSKARNIVVLSGAGISAASGVPTYGYAHTQLVQWRTRILY